jgi:hypothetical protein
MAILITPIENENELNKVHSPSRERSIKSYLQGKSPSGAKLA